MTCSFCGDEGYAFAPLGLNRDVWVPCPRCPAGQRRKLEPRAAAIVEGIDWQAQVVPIPGGPMHNLSGPAEEPCTPQQASRMLSAIGRTFHVGRDPQHTQTAREKREADAA